ncbi:MFS transporter [Demequina aestuarii]|uniref:MFS transporter n=1 Tax=Demequina aestuarii TaxID=327095 RepID=UPI0007802F36|nr:MFS transporter [Demequina aestuarii]
MSAAPEAAPAGGRTEREVAQRAVLRTLIIAQVLSGAGLAAGVTVGALLAAEMLESTSAAGVPALLFALGAGGSAVLIGAMSQRRGRRVGLAWGYAAGAVGALGVVMAAAIDSVPVLFASLLIYGAGSAANLQARYAGADLAPPARRARASAVVLVATTAGAVLGPQLAEASGALVEPWGLSALTGPFAVAALAYGVGAAVLALWLRPDPLLLALRLGARPADAPPVDAAADDDQGEPRWRPRVVGAIVAMVGTQAVMVGVMTMTPVHMTGHGHTLSAAATVISLHVAAMYLPAPLSGVVVDRWGVVPTVLAASVTLVAAAATLALAPGESLIPIAIGLALLGLGWSLGIVAGTQVLSTAPPLANRARLQGRADFFIAASSAAGGGASGLVVAGSSFAVLAWGGVAMAVAVALVAPSLRTNVTKRQNVLPLDRFEG